MCHEIQSVLEYRKLPCNSLILKLTTFYKSVMAVLSISGHPALRPLYGPVRSVCPRQTVRVMGYSSINYNVFSNLSVKVF